MVAIKVNMKQQHKKCKIHKILRHYLHGQIYLKIIVKHLLDYVLYVFLFLYE